MIKKIIEWFLRWLTGKKNKVIEPSVLQQDTFVMPKKEKKGYHAGYSIRRWRKGAFGKCHNTPDRYNPRRMKGKNQKGGLLWLD